MEEVCADASWLTAEHAMGTTIMAVEFDGGVIMAADSRTSTGIYVANRVSDKITPVAPRIYCCRSGSAADTQAISDYVRYYLKQHALELGREPLVGTAASLFRELCYQNKQHLTAGIICAGYDERHGGQVFTIPLGGSLVRQPMSIGGSGSGYIYGFCDATYRRGMSKAECKQFCIKAVALAMNRDGSSGGVIRLACIDKEGVEREVVHGEALPEVYHG